MDAVRVLYVDDSTLDAPKFSRWMEMKWAELTRGGRLKVDTCDSPERGLDLLLTGVYHILVADLRFPDKVLPDLRFPPKEVPLGLSLISEARKKYVNLGIVALSVGDDGLEQRSIDAGADSYISKQYVINDPESLLLGERLLESLRKHGREPNFANESVLEISEDAPMKLRTLIEIVGKVNIVNFAVNATRRDWTRIVPHFVRSGFSGASVLQVDCEVVEASGSVSESQCLLLKISKDEGALVGELKQDTSYFGQELFVPFLQLKAPLRSGSWFAIAGLFKEGAATIADWLLEEELTSGMIERELDHLFVKKQGLSQTYRGKYRDKTMRASTALWSILTPLRMARLLESIEILSSLASKHDPCKCSDLIALRRFVDSHHEIAGLAESRIADGVDICWSHGDLHTRNVLITDRGPRLIDPASICKLHWADDIARFVVDIIVSCWDSNTNGQEHEWDNMLEWCELTKRVIRGGRIPSQEKHNNNYASALRWLRGNVFSICDVDKGSSEWEFRLALGVEFMRATYRFQDVSTPKRVLALLAACDALHATKEAWESSYEGR